MSGSAWTKDKLLEHLAEAHGLHLDRPSTMEVLKVIHRAQHGPCLHRKIILRQDAALSGGPMEWGQPHHYCTECDAIVKVTVVSEVEDHHARKLALNPDPLAVVPDDQRWTSGMRGIVKEPLGREQKLRVWLATGGTEEQFNEDHPKTEGTL